MLAKIGPRFNGVFFMLKKWNKVKYVILSGRMEVL
jgi:hypothetical protein